MELARIGDMIAIPFFLLLILYFLKKERRTREEDVYLAFVLGAFVADIYFVFGVAKN
jgi:hypothetical protein